MNVLSLFDGISCARVAFDKARIPVASYYSSEIDKYAISISKINFPSIQRLGNIKDISNVPVSIDLVIGGSPCQDLSIAKKDREGLNGKRSSLFWEYVRILKLTNPKWFIFENVSSMSDQDKNIITETLGVEPFLFDASLVSAQCRKRLFWTNIPGVKLPSAKGIVVADILEKEVNEKYFIKHTEYTPGKKISTNTNKSIFLGFLKKNSQAQRIYSPGGKSFCLSANAGGLGGKTGLYKTGKTDSSQDPEKNVKIPEKTVRRLTPLECERLQGLPDYYTFGISDTQRYKCLGNAFNVDVVAHILSFIPEASQKKL